MTHFKTALHTVSGAGYAGRPLHYRRYGPLLGLLLCLGLMPAVTLANETAEPVATAAAAQVRLVNINTADAAALAAGLQGVGLSRAEDIIRYRETYGPFGTVEELVDVKGIGQATLDKNRAVITLE